MKSDKIQKKNPVKFQLNTEFQKYGRKDTFPVLVLIPDTSVPRSVPFPDFPENMETGGSNVE